MSERCKISGESCPSSLRRGNSASRACDYIAFALDAQSDLIASVSIVKAEAETQSPSRGSHTR